MHLFTDRDSHVWQLHLDDDAVGRVREHAGLDLAALGDLPGLRIHEKLTEPPARFAGVLWTLCELQAVADGVTPEQFGLALASVRVSWRAGLALSRAWCECYPMTRGGRELSHLLATWSRRN